MPSTSAKLNDDITRCRDEAGGPRQADHLRNLASGASGIDIASCRVKGIVFLQQLMQ